MLYIYVSISINIEFLLIFNVCQVNGKNSFKSIKVIPPWQEEMYKRDYFSATKYFIYLYIAITHFIGRHMVIDGW